MDRRSMEALRLDRRLIGRRGWISGDELEKALSQLPDVADKIAPPEDEPGEAGSESAEGAAEASGD